MAKDYHTLSFFQSGKRRRIVLKALKDPKTPKEIATMCKISMSNVSNALAELVKEKYVECLTPKVHIYKYFGLTNKGKKALNLLSKEA